MPNQVYVNFSHPANQPVLTYLQIAQPDQALTYLLAEVNAFSLGTHPDLVNYLFKLAAPLPVPCGCIINQRSNPILVNPVKGVIFAVAGGTSTLAFRLPEPDLSQALATPGYGTKYMYGQNALYASSFGSDWALLNSFDKNNPALCKRAFDYAGTL